MFIDPFTILSSFSQLFNLVQSMVLVQLILVSITCSIFFGLVLLNKTSLINLSESSSKAFTVTVLCLIVPALLIGSGTIAIDFFLFPYLFEMLWVG